MIYGQKRQRARKNSSSERKKARATKNHNLSPTAIFPLSSLSDSTEATVTSPLSSMAESRFSSKPTPEYPPLDAEVLRCPNGFIEVYLPDTWFGV
jgi:hypothetical protein